ncbi:MAG: hypothetical protein IK143_04115, partial [Bacteroidales bacterium]|nr:hypothetical protein [Bacteroidales bacterium]
TNLFQCLGMVSKSIFLSLSRQLIFLVPALYTLPRLLESELGVWYSMPVADVLSTILSSIMVVWLIHRLNRLKDGDDPSILGSKIKGQ